MARASRQKLARESTAAYAASQPLFDVLRNGTNKIGEQKFLLTQARDLVQNMHVKLVNANGNDDAEKHDRYVDHVVKAWRSATLVYSTIFEELASITAPDATEGRAASKGHEEFMAMSATVEAAKKLAMSYKPTGTPPTMQPPRNARVEDVEVDEEEDKSGDNDLSGSSPAQTKVTQPLPAFSMKPGAASRSVDGSFDGAEKGSNATPNDPHSLASHSKRPLSTDDGNDQRPGKAQKLSANIPLDSHGKKVFWERGASQPNVPFAELGAADKNAWRAEKSRQKREKRSIKARSVATAASSDGKPLDPDRAEGAAVDPNSLSAGKENTVPGVEYEDVSAEVEARLKAKEERKKAKKEEKKRKRDSGASVLEATPSEVGVEKPKKKKVKAETADDGKANGVVVDKLEKRKKEAVEVEPPNEARKKRKKNN
ncbi:hypothetical protein LTR36_002008 [Oleoguttula mirabilis]|uniref:Uncharacterized protein n=1 Tax=Oleoguttula mirabilis TaxID=1507867 RepID=A0AAV9JLF6_9PEZI|nr:hypothetical protein LTR36_002008 [Oleoguttula mirabilis]